MVVIGPSVCKWVKFYIFRLFYTLNSHDLWPSFVTFDLMNMWRFLHYINKPSLLPIILQVFKRGHFHIFSLQLDLRWPLTLISDLWPHQQMKVPMSHLWPNFGWNPSKHVEGRAKHRRTGRCGVLAIATWAAWFWAAQGRLLTKKKEGRKGRKGHFNIFATVGLKTQFAPGAKC